ncbi:MAG TPA: VOC family protein [Gemmatimonadales bacterium]|nr:VOC family protein [Gemmatimonadales bacterium]
MPAQLQGDGLQAALTVADLERSTTWYTAVFGFVVEQRHERDGRVIGVRLKAGAVRLLLTQDDGAKGADRIKGQGFSLHITTQQNVDALAASIKARGVQLDTEPVTAPHGARIFRVRDPDGFRFTISSTPAA